MTFDEKINDLKDTVASLTAHLDQLQTDVNHNRHRLGDVEAWEIQAEIDRHRFAVELDRLQIKALKFYAK